jgi:Holliday junction resolvasome RuvABC endonuclease subunit
MLILGLDISTSCTGFCVVNEENKVIFLDYENFKGCKDFWEKTDRIEEKIIRILAEIKPLGKIEKVFVEESLQKFRPGLSSAKTLTTLSKFNGIVCHLVRRQTGCSPNYLNVNTARKLVGLKIERGKDTKEQVFEWVKSDVYMHAQVWQKKKMKSGPRKGLEILDPVCYDMADAYVISKAGLVNLLKN